MKTLIAFFGLFFLILVASIEISNLYKDCTPPRSNLEISVLREDYIPGDLGLNFIKDEKITARVISDRSVEFEGHETSLSKAGLEAIRKCGYDWTSLRGPEYWVYEGNSILWHIKNVEDKYEDR
jgi:hypothetical protein